VPVSVAIQALKIEADKLHEIGVEDELTLVDNACEEGVFLQALQFVTTKIRSDLHATSGHTSPDHIDIAHAKETVPNSLYMLMKMLINKPSADDVLDDTEDVKILSILQDIVSVASKGKKVTPKQIGIGMSVHQATR